MPAELVESSGHDPAGVTERERRGLALGLRRVSGVTRHAGDAHDAVVGVEVRLEVVVCQRPVVGDAVEGLGTEVGRVKAREVGAPVDRAAADGIVHQGRDCGVGIVDGIVFGKSPDVGIGVEVRLAVGLPVHLCGRVLGGIEPASLLQAQDIESILRQAPCERGPGCAGSDYQDINPIV